uniref:glycine rich extracellular protein 1 isoform X2 n=1 Tax=Myodes glareolus TaxID=447135 RepID=UPI00202139F3|nr:glycine rich extracellular protein 1 isoform X2 [Myodes glareolus]
MKPPKPGYGNGNGIRVGAFPGVGAQPGLGAGTKTQKPGEQAPVLPTVLLTLSPPTGDRLFSTPQTLGSHPVFRLGYSNGNSLGAQPGLGNGNGLGAGAFPGTGAQPGLGEGPKPHKTGPAPQNGYGPGFGNGNGLGLGAQPGPPAQNGHGVAIRVGVKPPKSGFGNGNGIGPAAQPGFGGGRKPQKPGYGNGNGPDALPGVGGKPQKPGPAAQNGYRQDYGTDMKPQKSGFRNGHGHGVQLGYRNGLGTRAFQGKGPQPGYMPENRLGVFTGLGGAMKPPKTVYSNGQGMAAQPGSCHGGVAPPQLLPRSPTPGAPSDKGGSWGLKSQLLPPVQNGKFPAPTPAIQWGLKPQKAGYQAFNGYGAEAEPGFRGLKLQKVGFYYGNGALEAGISPEILQSGFPIASSFRNGQAETLQGSPWPALQPWGAGMKAGYGYAGLGNQAGPYGHLRPELGREHFGGSEVKADTKSQLGNRYRGHCPSGKC